MAEPTPRLRVVGDAPSPPRRTRGPGLGVIFVGLYALLFGGALWLLRSQIPSLRRAAASPASNRARPAAEPPRPLSRDSLIAGLGLAPLARDEYLRELSTERCPCGCGLALRDCLLSEEKCARSAELAQERLERLR